MKKAVKKAPGKPRLEWEKQSYKRYEAILPGLTRIEVTVTQGDIVCLNHVSDGELAWLYRHAAFTVFPSLYEGWGLPVVESLAWGKFCLASSAASLPEAGGTWAEYQDPWDLPAWVDRLGHYMQHPQEVQARNDRIAREFRAPGWAQTAQAIHDVVLAASPKEQP